MKRILLTLVVAVIIVVLGGLIWQYSRTAVKSAQPSVSLVFPNGGEVLTEGSTYTIKWETKNIPAEDKVSITIRRVPPPPLPSEGQEFDPIIFTNLDNTGSKEWTVALMYPEGDYILGISCYASVPVTNPISGESSAVFKIVKSGLVYTNSQYGFSFSLPASWKGYSIVNSQWTGYPNNSQGGQGTEINGPEILIRNPKWTVSDPYQDIPIMVFTIDQWNLVEQEKLSVSAAPIGPTELGRNNKYVFALPARYNFAYPTGWQEVDQILKGNPLKAF
ncbi:MAG: Ser-Thr-rich GPI-anchored membrane family protein [Caldisericaceae bacterium]